MTPLAPHSRWPFAAVVLFWLSGGATAAEPTIEDVKKAWKARQDATPAFHFAWDEQVTVKAGSHGSHPPDYPGPHPPKDTVLVGSRMMAVDSDKTARGGDERLYDVSAKSFIRYSRFEHFDGSVRVSTYSHTESGLTLERRETDQAKAASAIPSIAHCPIRYVYRPLGPQSLQMFGKVKLSGRTENIGGAPCVEIVPDYPRVVGEYFLWCDPAREFLPIRYRARYSNGGSDLDIEYRQDYKGRWVPKRWLYIHYTGQEYANYEVRYAIKAVVKTAELDPTFAADAFSPVPKPGNRVVVVKGDEVLEDYLVGPDRSKRPVAAREQYWLLYGMSKADAEGPHLPLKK